MNEETFNMALRKFLKTVGVTSQREIESAVNQALDSGAIKGNAKLKAKMTLEIPEVGLTRVVEGDISLE